MKKIIAVILSLILAFSLCALPALAEDSAQTSSAEGSASATAASEGNPGGEQTAVEGDPGDVTTASAVTPDDVTAAPDVTQVPVGVITDGRTDFTLEELNRIADDVRAAMADDPWIADVMLNEERGTVVIICAEDADPLKPKELAKTLSDKYGVEVTGAIVFTGENANAELDTELDGAAEASALSNAWLYAVICGAVLLIFCGAMFALQRRRQLACQTESGVVSENEAPSRQQVESGVKKSEYAPKDSAFSEICDKIERTK